MYIYHTWKKKLKTTNQKIILADTANFSFDFGLIFLQFYGVLFHFASFFTITTATSNQDTDFFFMYYAPLPHTHNHCVDECFLSASRVIIFLEMTRF